MSKINLRKAIPIIGAISSGKSFFVDSLLGLNILQSESSITTKFVCIIQHHKNLKEPKFYQINLIEKNLDENNMMIYEAEIKGEIITGYNTIKEKIKEINRVQKEIPSDKIKYEELFYVLEIEIKNIKNEQLLNNYDFYDIPGLDEYIPEKINTSNIDDKTSEPNKEKSKEKMKYIEGLFKYFKSRIDFGVFVINAESAYANASKEVISNIAITIKPKKIRNYLIVLNKIDRQSEPKLTINKVKSIITNNLLDQINLSNNVFLPLDSRQLKHQTLMREHFEDYLFFLFNQYFAKSVIPFKDNREGTEEENKYNTKIYSFQDFLYEHLTEGKGEDQIEEYFEEMEEKFSNNDYNIDELKINEIYEKIKKQENYIINFGIDPDDDVTLKIMKSLYINFKEQKNIPYSDNVNSVFNYFDNILNNLNKNSDDEITQPPTQLIPQDFRTQFENFANKFKRFHEENKKFQIIGELSNSIEQLYNYIENQQIIYIGIFGNSSTGKSLIFNNLFGIDILTVNEGECTKRGIIIEDGENIAMYKGLSEVKKLNGRDFNIFKRSDVIAIGEENVRERLKELNTYYAKDTDNNTFDFFIISLPIKFFEEIKLDKETRRSIKFLDLPGYNTAESNNFIYEPVIESISCFLMVFKNGSIGSIDNLKSNLIYKNLKFKSKRAVKSLNDSEFLKCCLFIMNLWDEEKPTETNLKDWSNSIKNFLLNVYENDNNINLNLTYLNALLYHNFLIEEKYFFNYEYLQKEMLGLFNAKKTRIGKKIFLKFFAETLKKKIKDLFKINEKEIKEIISKEMNEEIYNQINLLFTNSIESTKSLTEKDIEKYLKEICCYLSYGQKNIKNIPNYQNSYIENLFKDLSNRINFSKELNNNNFKEHLLNAIDIFNIFFNIDIENQNQEKKDKFKQESLKLFGELQECFKSYDFGKYFDDFILRIEKFFDNKINSVEDLLKNNDNDLDKAYNKIKEEYNNLAISMEEKIKSYYENFQNEVKKIYNLLVYNLFPDLESDKQQKIMESISATALPAIAMILMGNGLINLLIEGIIKLGLGLDSLIKKLFKKSRLNNLLKELKDSKINEFKLIKERFMKEFKEYKESLESNAMSLINIKTLELSSKSAETKKFYSEMKIDYENLLESIKTQFKI